MSWFDNINWLNQYDKAGNQTAQGVLPVSVDALTSAFNIWGGLQANDLAKQQLNLLQEQQAQATDLFNRTKASQDFMVSHNMGVDPNQIYGSSPTAGIPTAGTPAQGTPATQPQSAPVSPNYQSMQRWG